MKNGLSTQKKLENLPMKWINTNLCYLGDIDNFKLLKDEFDKILSVKKIEYKNDQLALQKSKDWDEEKFGREEWCSVGKPSDLPDKYKSNEELFNETIDILKGTYIEQLIIKYNIFKTRCAILSPKSCYTWHFDNWPRIHFVIDSNPKCFFLFGNHKKEYLKEGKIYFTDTTDSKGHTAINASWYPRIHIFGNIKSFQDKTWEMTEERKLFNEKEKAKDMRLLYT